MKTDYKKTYRELYLPKPGVSGTVTVPTLHYLMVSGTGHPEQEEFGLAAQTVFPVAYVSKFILREKNQKNDFTIMPMEVKWRLDRSRKGAERYSWTVMVMQPETMTEETVREALDRLARKKKTPPLADRLRLQAYTAGVCGQILHIGPYEGPMESTFALLKKHLSENGYAWEPDSQDVYYNDARRCAPEKLRTLMRVRAWPEDGPLPVLEDPFQQHG